MVPTLEISTDPERLDVDLIYGFLSTSYWATGRPRHVVERSIENSLCFGGYLERQQVAFARVISDRAVFAYLADVFVIPAHRGQGIGKALIRTVLAHPDLQNLRLFILRTQDAQGLYSQFGFHSLSHPEWTMAIQTKQGQEPGTL